MFYKFCFLYILNLTGYSQQNKESIHKSVCEKYQNLSEEKKKHQYACECYKNLLEDEKQRLVEYGKKIILECKKLIKTSWLFYCLTFCFYTKFFYFMD